MLGLGGFPKVQFTTAPGGRFGVFVHTTLSTPDAFTHQGIISCHTYRMPPSCLENSSVRFSEVLMHSSYTQPGKEGWYAHRLIWKIKRDASWKMLILTGPTSGKYLLLMQAGQLQNRNSVHSLLGK